MTISAQISPDPSSHDERSTRLVRRRLQRADLDPILLADHRRAGGGSRGRSGGVVLVVVVVGDADEAAALAAEQAGAAAEEAPGALGVEVREAAQLVGLGEAALVDGDEGDHPLLDRLPILGSDAGGVPIGRAEVEGVAAVATAARKDRELSLGVRGINLGLITN